MIDLLKEYKCEFFGPYQNMDEFTESILGYKHGNVQVMRKIARHFFIFNPNTKEYELDKNFWGYDSTKLEQMAKWSKEELLNADINPSMTLIQIDAKVRNNGKNRVMKVTAEEYKIITAYEGADDIIKDKIKSLLIIQ